MRRSMTTIAGAAVLVLGACQTAPVREVGEPTMQPAAPPPTGSYIPAGTLLQVQLNDALSTRESEVGDIFTATVQRELVAANGDVVVPVGSTITGLITGIGGVEEQAAIRLNFTRITINGVSHPFTADITATRTMDEVHRGADVARAAAAGAAAGAVLGAIISGGRLRDALIGGALGAGAGTIISLGVGGVDQVLPAGTHMTLQTVQRIELR